MAAQDGRVAIITGAGRGLGREHALKLVSEGTRVVINDLGGDPSGTGEDRAPAQQVVDEIEALGGEAVANVDDVSTPEGADALVETALERFGRLDVLVNNAGILRDRALVSMSVEEWDAVVKVHLRGHFLPTQRAAAHWRERSKAGDPVSASVINTTSAAGLFGNFGQTNYAAAKGGIAAFTLTAAMELARYGVRVNAVAPLARTRLTMQTPGFDQVAAAPESEDAFDAWDPANVSPLVAYLASESCPVTGGVFHVGGREVGLLQGWTLAGVVTSDDGRWTVEQLDAEMKTLLEGRDDIASAGDTIATLTQGFLGRQAG